MSMKVESRKGRDEWTVIFCPLCCVLRVHLWGNMYCKKKDTERLYRPLDPASTSHSL